MCKISGAPPRPNWSYSKWCLQIIMHSHTFSFKQVLPQPYLSEANRLAREVKMRWGAFRCFAPCWLFIQSLRSMYKLCIFLSPLKLIILCWVDSQLQEGIIQSTSAALHGEFSCRYKPFTTSQQQLHCWSMVVVIKCLTGQPHSHGHREWKTKKWQHISVLWLSNVQRRDIQEQNSTEEG